jgi:hypothetical protein
MKQNQSHSQEADTEHKQKHRDTLGSHMGLGKIVCQNDNFMQRETFVKLLIPLLCHLKILITLCYLVIWFIIHDYIYDSFNFLLCKKKVLPPEIIFLLSDIYFHISIAQSLLKSSKYFFQVFGLSLFEANCIQLLIPIYNFYCTHSIFYCVLLNIYFSIYHMPDTDPCSCTF